MLLENIYFWGNAFNFFRGYFSNGFIIVLMSSWVYPKILSLISKFSFSPPIIIDNIPFSAPAWPPETGASKKVTCFEFNFLLISCEISEEVVVWSIIIVPGWRLSRKPLSEKKIFIRSSSLPTQITIISEEIANSLRELDKVPLYSDSHFNDFSWDLLKTDTSNPFFAKWPAIG